MSQMPKGVEHERPGVGETVNAVLCRCHRCRKALSTHGQRLPRHSGLRCRCHRCRKALSTSYSSYHDGGYPAVPMSQMPKGVEHPLYEGINPTRESVPMSQMPKGVEHPRGAWRSRPSIPVPMSQMPKGVEHGSGMSDLVCRANAPQSATAVPTAPCPAAPTFACGVSSGPCTRG